MVSNRSRVRIPIVALAQTPLLAPRPVSGRTEELPGRVLSEPIPGRLNLFARQPNPSFMEIASKSAGANVVVVLTA